MSVPPHSFSENVVADVPAPDTCTHLTGADHVASLLAALLADDARRAAYGTAGVRRARNRYRWARVVADTDTVYRQVLAGPVRTDDGDRSPVEAAR